MRGFYKGYELPDGTFTIDLSDYITKDELNEALGDIDEALDAILGSNTIPVSFRTSIPIKATKNICAGGGVLVTTANTNSNNAICSTDGFTWDVVTLSSYGNYQSIAYGNGRFVILPGGGSKLVWYSDDGITWHQSSLPANAYWESVCFGNGVFVAVANNILTIAYSYDGEVWSYSSSNSAYKNWADVTYGNGRFVVIGTTVGASLYSDDGINWVESADPKTYGNYKRCGYGGGLFAAVDNNGGAITSYDGVSWATVTNGTPTNSIQNLSYIKGVWFWVSSTAVYVSSDFENWKTLDIAGEGTPRSAEYFDGKVYIITGVKEIIQVPWSVVEEAVNNAG